jgi:hypothetical protein
MDCSLYLPVHRASLETLPPPPQHIPGGEKAVGEAFGCSPMPLKPLRWILPRVPVGRYLDNMIVHTIGAVQVAWSHCN